MRASLSGRILLLVALAGGCGSDSKDPGPPQLVKFLAVVPSDMLEIDLLAPPDGGVPAIPGTASFTAVFNQLLDGNKIETAAAGQVTPKTDVASIVWTNAPAGAPPIVASTTYDPSGAASVTVPAPKVIITPSPGLPSGAQLQVKLDRAKVTGKKGAAFVGSDVQMVSTQPFAASASVMPDGVAGADLQLAVTFTNVPAMTVAQHITLTSGGMALTVTATPDPADPRKIGLMPMTWTPGQSYTLTVDKDAADLFGVKVAEPLVVKFSIRDPNAEAGAPGPDGGAVDAAGEAGVADAGASDAAVDAGATPDAASDTAAPQPDATGDDAAGGG
jgi:hypothetical protein